MHLIVYLGKIGLGHFAGTEIVFQQFLLKYQSCELCQACRTLFFYLTELLHGHLLRRIQIAPQGTLENRTRGLTQIFILIQTQPKRFSQG